MIASQLIDLSEDVVDAAVKRRLLTLAREVAALESAVDSDILAQSVRVFLLRLQRKTVEEMHLPGAARVLTVALAMADQLSPAQREAGRAAMLKAITSHGDRHTRAHGHRR